MKLFRFALVVLLVSVNLVIAFPSLAEKPLSLANHPHDFEVGQKVIWLYTPRSNSANVQRIPVEIVKLGSKQVQIQVLKNNKELINRWVNRDRLESEHKVKESVSK